MSTETNLQIYTSRPWEMIKTSFLVLTWIVLGMNLEIVGTTIGVLAENTSQTTAGISDILVSRSAGYMFGNIVGALTQKTVKKYPEILLSSSFLIAAIAIFVTPYVSTLYLLSVVFFFQGISQGVTDLAGTSLMLTMWTDNAAAPLNIVHLGFGFGAVFSNFLVKPYLVEKSSNNDNKDLIITTNGMKSQSDIRTPYSIIGFICILITIGHLIIAIREYQLKKKVLKSPSTDYSSVSTKINTNERKEKISAYSPRSCGNGYFGYGLSLSIVWIFYMFFLSGNDQTFGKFFFTYVETSGLPKTINSTWFMIVYWLSYSVGRLICAIISIFLPVHVALIGLWICGLTLAVAWFIFVWVIGITSLSLLILGAFTGLVFSPTFPLSFAFINQRLNVNPLLVGLLLCGASLGTMVFLKAAGIILDRYPNQFPTILISCVILSIILFTIAMIISTIHQRKLPPKKENINDEEQQMESYLSQNQ